MNKGVKAKKNDDNSKNKMMHNMCFTFSAHAFDPKMRFPSNEICFANSRCNSFCQKMMC